jgi:hypothetical protein
VYNTCYIYRDREYELILGKALKAGCQRHNDNFSMMLLPESLADFDKKIQPYDIVIFFGCAGLIPHCYRKAQETGKTVIYCDKGYCRNKSLAGLITEYVRVSVNEFQPLTFVKNANCTHERFVKLRVDVKKLKKEGKHIIVCGGSQKYSDWHELGDANIWAEKVIKELKQHTNRPIYYRPKPSFKGGKPISGSYFSPPTQSLEKLLENAYAVVVWGSNAALEASYFGIKTLVLGDAIVKSISKTELKDIEKLYIPTMEERMKLYRNIAHCEYTYDEFKSGLAWEHIRPQLKINESIPVYSI